MQDQAQKGQRLAIHADSAAVATSIPVSNSSNGAPNGVYPALLPRLDDTCSHTGQVKGGNGQDQDEPFQSESPSPVHWCGSDSRPIFHRESWIQRRSASRTRAIRSGIRGLRTSHEPGVIGLVKQAGQGEVDWSHGVT